MTLPAPNPSPPSPPPNWLVTFNYVDWISLFPEFASVATPIPAQQYFNMACMYCDNTPNSFAADDLNTLTYLLYLLTAHIAKLYATINGQPGAAASGMVGQTTSASEGSVSIGTAQITPSGDMAVWLGQTQYGLTYWTATLKYRTAFWLPRNRVAPIGGNLLGALRNAATYRRYPWFR